MNFIHCQPSASSHFSKCAKSEDLNAKLRLGSVLIIREKMLTGSLNSAKIKHWRSTLTCLDEHTKIELCLFKKEDYSEYGSPHLTLGDRRSDGTVLLKRSTNEDCLGS